jgi:hypothetical protein
LSDELEAEDVGVHAGGDVDCGETGETGGDGEDVVDVGFYGGELVDC